MKKTSQYTISQTLIKAFKGEYCPAQIQAMYVEKTHQMEATLPMQRGVYFETQCIGGGAHGQSLDDLPRLRNGNKNAAHMRIDEQIQAFPTILKKHGIVIKDKQVVMKRNIDDIISIEGTLDFTGSIKDDKLGIVPEAVFDIKLTGSIYKEFGDWSWHFPHNMDHTQAFMYTSLYSDSEYRKGPEVPFYYIVFDYAPEPSYKIIRKKVETLDLMELEESIRHTLDKILYHEKNGWDVSPSFENCKRKPPGVVSLFTM